jgi:hypothetical protein
MSIEATVDIEVGEFANDGGFCDMVGDICADVIRDSGEVESIVRDILESDISDYIDDAKGTTIDLDDDNFINAVAEALIAICKGEHVGARE